MRGFAFAMLLLPLLVPSPARADRHVRPDSNMVIVDTSSVLPKWLHPQLEVGPGWMQAPVDIRRRYAASMSGSAGVESRPRPGFAIAARLSYWMLTSEQVAYSAIYDPTSVAPGYTWLGGGTGHLLDLVGTASVQVLPSWWLEAGGGGGHFGSGYPDEAFTDPITRAVYDLPGKTGFGGEVTAGTRYEFQPDERDHLYVTVRWASFSRGPDTMQFWAIRFGYRWI